MPEYIEREAIKYEQWPVGPLYEPIMVVRKKTIDNIPAVDVAPVQHGRWIEPPRLYYGTKQYECSLCYSDTFWNKHSITEKYQHCPNCGAKMDLEGKHDP